MAYRTEFSGSSRWIISIYASTSRSWEVSKSSSITWKTCGSCGSTTSYTSSMACCTHLSVRRSLIKSDFTGTISRICRKLSIIGGIASQTIGAISTCLARIVAAWTSSWNKIVIEFCRTATSWISYPISSASLTICRASDTSSTFITATEANSICCIIEEASIAWATIYRFSTVF